MILLRNKNRSVVPFKGELFKQIERNFASVPVTNSMGQKIIDPATKKVRTTRAEEVVLPFYVYSDLVSMDEYLVSKIEELEESKVQISSELAIRFAASWRFILRRWAASSPKGMRENCIKIENLLKSVDEEMTLLINDRNTPLTQKYTDLKSRMTSPEGKRLMEFYMEFMKDLFKTFRMEVAVSIKVNGRMNVRYLQFKLNTQISTILESASDTEQARIQKALRLTELRDLKLKAQLDNMGFIVESVPVYEETGKPLFVMIAYDPKYKSIPVPKIAARKKLSDEERALVKKTFPHQSGLYSILPSEPTPDQVQQHKQTIQFLNAQIEANKTLATKEYKPGFGFNADGTPQAQDSIGRPILKYTQPESVRRDAAKLVKTLEKLLHNQTRQEDTEQHRKAKEDYQKKVAPYMRGVYHPKFTSPTGTEYQSFSSIQELKDKMATQAATQALAEKITPTIGTTKIKVNNYPEWNDKTQQIEYKEAELNVAEISYPTGSQYIVPRFTQELNQVDWKNDDLITREIRDFGEGQVLSGISRSVVTKKIVVDGSPKSLIVKGRYAGYLLENIINIEGRFIEGGYILKANGENKEVPLFEDRMIVKDGKVQTIDFLSDSKVQQRLIEPYITLSEDGQRLLMGVPGGRSTSLDQHIMNKLAEKVATIQRVSNPDIPNDYHKARNPFYLFNVENFELVRKSLGSVALSKSASDFIDAYHKRLKSQEAAMTAENLERFTPAALGGFVRKTDRGPFLFNNKQLEALAWLEASDMRGVVGLDTGVGKTVTALAAIKTAINQEMFEGTEKRRFLFVSPARLVGNLKKEVEAYMDEGGEQVTLADGTTDTSPNWRKIILDRIVEMSYDKYTEMFQDFGGQFAKSEEGASLLNQISEIERSIQLQGRPLNQNEPDGDRYPIFEDTEIETKKKKIKELKKEVRKLQKALVVESYPKADKYFQKEFYACFFDEVNEALVGDKRKALASLKHPRKVFLTASTMQKDPVDLYRFVTLAKGADYSAADEEAFVKKYGNVVGGRFVGIKDDAETQREFYTWVKENAFFAFKESVNYEEVGLPKLLPKTSRTLSVKMPVKVQDLYRVEASKIKRELDAMLKKYRDLSKSLDVYDDAQDIDFRSLDAKWVGRGKKRELQKLMLQDFAEKSISPVLKKLIRLANRPESLIKGAKNVKVEQATALAAEYRTSKVLYFTSDNLLAVETARQISKKLPSKVHAVCLPEEIRWYQAGKLIYSLKAKFNMGLEDFEKIPEANLIKKANELEEGELEATWAIDISRVYINKNSHIGTTTCTDAYAFGFNFQSFTKVIHLDRGDGFNSEVVKQRTARAYRAGQAQEVEEIFIDATLGEETTSDSAVSGNIPTENIENLSVDELKGLVAQQDQEFFMDIIRKSLAMDLTSSYEGVSRDTAKTVNFTNEMLSAIIEPTTANITALERTLDDFEKNPINHLALNPSRYDKYTNLTINGKTLDLSDKETIEALDLVGFNHLGGEESDVVIRGSQNGKFIRAVHGDSSVEVNLGEKEINFEYIYLDPCAPIGAGLKTVLSLLFTAIKGNKTVSASAVSDGKYIWPRMGFDGQVNLNDYEENIPDIGTLKDKLGEKVSVLDILALELSQGDKFGEKWWSQYARNLQVKFDPTKGSKSMLVINTYLRLKCQQMGISVQDFLNTPLDPFNVDDPECWKASGKFTFSGRSISFNEVISMYPTEFKKAWYANDNLRHEVIQNERENYPLFLKKHKVKHIEATRSMVSKLANAEANQNLAKLVDDPILDAAWDVIRRRRLILSQEIDKAIDEGDTDLSLVQKLKGDM